MSRTHAQVSYGFRTLGIAGFVVALSFFINTAPALARSLPSPVSDSTSAGRGTNSQFDDTSVGGAALESNLANLQERIKQLTEMKAQLEKLLTSLQKRVSATEEKPECLTAHAQMFQSVAPITPGSSAECHPVVHRPYPACQSALFRKYASHPMFQSGGSGNMPPLCRDSLGTITLQGHTATTSFICADCGPNGFGPKIDHSDVGTEKNSPWNRANSAWNGHISSSSEIWSQSHDSSYAGGSSSAGVQYAASNTDSFGGISTSSWNRYVPMSGGMFGGGSSAGVQYATPGTWSSGMVHGASSDMSAEMADVLSGLQSDLLDIRDVLDQ